MKKLKNAAAKAGKSTKDSLVDLTGQNDPVKLGTSSSDKSKINSTHEKLDQISDLE